MPATSPGSSIFDMAILAEPWSRYERYAQQVAKNTASTPTCFTTPAERNSSKTRSPAVIRPYHTDWFREHHEAAALANAMERSPDVAQVSARAAIQTISHKPYSTTPAHHTPRIPRKASPSVTRLHPQTHSPLVPTLPSAPSSTLYCHVSPHFHPHLKHSPLVSARPPSQPTSPCSPRRRASTPFRQPPVSAFRRIA